MEVKFLKLREAAKLPFKKHQNDAGYDISWTPTDIEGVVTVNMLIQPGESVILPTGLKALFPEDHVMEVKNRSSVAAKKSLLVGACIIDSTYRGEIFVNLHNVSREPVSIDVGERIAQIIVYPIKNLRIEEISIEEYEKQENKTSRADGALGSTGNK